MGLPQLEKRPILPAHAAKIQVNQLVNFLRACSNIEVGVTESMRYFSEKKTLLSINGLYGGVKRSKSCSKHRETGVKIPTQVHFSTPSFLRDPKVPANVQKSVVDSLVKFQGSISSNKFF